MRKYLLVLLVIFVFSLIFSSCGNNDPLNGLRQIGLTLEKYKDNPEKAGKEFTKAVKKYSDSVTKALKLYKADEIAEDKWNLAQYKLRRYFDELSKNSEFMKGAKEGMELFNEALGVKNN